MSANLGRRPLSRVELWRISLYWLALSGLWAGLGFLLLQAMADHFICPSGVETTACAALPESSLTPIVGDLRLKPEEAIGLVALVGSLVAVIVQPTAAALSDYTRSRLGRRRPWILVGTALDVVFLVALASSQTFIAMAALVVLLQFSSNMAQGPFQGYVPDLVPEEQVGTASGLFGLMSVGGQLVGVAIAAAAVVVDNLAAGVIAFAVLEVATMLPAVLGVADRPVEMPQRSGTVLAGVRGALAEAWGHRSFVWLLVSRFFILMTTGTVVATAHRFLTRSMGYSEAGSAAAIMVLLTLTVLSAASVAGWAGGASDRYGRKPIIWTGCLVGAIGMTALALTPAQPEFALLGLRFPIGGLAAIPVGIGAGMFVSVDWALMVDIIPRVTAGRYMGISNVVTATSGAVAGTIAGFVVGSTAGPGGDVSFGPRLAIGLTVAWYAIGAWALRRVDTRPFSAQMGQAPHPLPPAPAAPAGTTS
jgi:Na+/melibiose symporter-like transporter